MAEPIQALFFCGNLAHETGKAKIIAKNMGAKLPKP